jgi:CRP-like cAMP-binding protein
MMWFAPEQFSVSAFTTFIAMLATNITAGSAKTNQLHTHGPERLPSSSQEFQDLTLRLPSRELFASVTATRSTIRFRKGQIIFTQGTTASALFAVTEGLVKLAATAEGGKEMIIDVIVEGDFFGEDALISPEISRHYNAICITDAVVLKVDAQQLSNNLKSNAETAHMFIAYLLKRNRALQEHLANCLLNAGPERLICTLKANEERLRQTGKLSQQTLGEMIGMTRQYINFLLRGPRRPSVRSSSTKSASLPKPADVSSRTQDQQLRNQKE